MTIVFSISPDLLFNMYRTLSSRRKRVVVVGGGFLGMTTARLLDEMSRFEVILVDTKEYFEYTPAMIYPLVDPGSISKWTTHYSGVVKNGSVIVNPVQSVARDHVVAGGEKIPYDYLVLSPGSSYTTQLKGTNVTTSYRAKKMAVEFKSLEAAQNVVVIGGGAAGVEVSTIIAEKFPEKKITLVEANPTLLKNVAPMAQVLALKKLQEFNITVILGERVTEIDNAAKKLQTSNGTTVAFDKIIVATGPSPNTDFLAASLPPGTLNEKKELRVNKAMQVNGFTHIFSGGDCADAPIPKLAYNSAVHGVSIARNICRLEKGKQVAVAGTKGLAREKKFPYALVISIGLKQSIGVFWNKKAFLSEKLAHDKPRFCLTTQDMVLGRKPVWNLFGQLPKRMDAVQQEAK